MRSALSSFRNQLRSFCSSRDFTPNMPHTNPNDYIETIVCKKEDIPENSMKEVDVGFEDEKVLLVNQKGKLYAVGNKCTHYGAPLVRGALGDGRVRCPWHGACFNIATGDIEDFPGLDSLPCYNVSVTPDNSILLKAKKSDITNKKRIAPTVNVCCDNREIFVVVGGGPSGATCVETLRKNGYNGRLIFVTDENVLPYDRVKLSKQLDVKVENILLRNQEFYNKNKVEVLKGSKITAESDFKNKKIVLQNGTCIEFSKLYLATGSSPRTTPLANEIKNIFYLRSIDDANCIAPHITPNTNVVVVGSSFIGMEAAAFCAGKVKSITVIGRGSVPFQESLGKEVGERIAKLFESKGVNLIMKANVTHFDRDGHNQVVCAHLDNKKSIPAELVIIGIGTVLNTKYLEGKGIDLNKQKAVVVDEYLQTTCPSVYAGGDIAYAPLDSFFNQNASIGHYQLAQYHGRTAALNMVNKQTPLQTIPFFWTSLFGISFRFSGYAAGHTSVEVVGDLENWEFAAYYCNGNKVIAILTVGVDPLAARFAENIKMKRYLNKSELADHAWAGEF